MNFEVIPWDARQHFFRVWDRFGLELEAFSRRLVCARPCSPLWRRPRGRVPAGRAARCGARWPASEAGRAGSAATETTLALLGPSWERPCVECCRCRRTGAARWPCCGGAALVRALRSPWTCSCDAARSMRVRAAANLRFESQMGQSAVALRGNQKWMELIRVERLALVLVPR